MSALIRSNVRDAGYLVGSQVLASALTFATGVAVARALGPAGKGFYDVVMGSATLLATLLGLSLGSGLFFYASRGPVGRRVLLPLALIVLVQGGLAATVLLAGRTHPGVAWLLPQGSGAAVALVALVLLALQGQQYAQGLIKGRGHFRAFAVSELIARGGALLGVVALTIAGTRAPAAYVLSFAVATIVSVAMLAATVGSETRTGGGGIPLGGALRYSLPLLFGNLAQLMNYRLDIFFVKHYVGLAGVGTYTVAVWLAQVVWLIPNALAALVMRAVAQQGGSPAALQRTAAVNRLCLALSLLVGLALAVTGTLGMTAVFGSQFAGSVEPLLVLLPGVVLFCPTIVLSSYLNGVRRQALTAWVSCGALIVTVGANLALIPQLGVSGAALASTLSYLGSTAATVALLRHMHPDLPLATLFVPQPADLATLRALGAAACARVGVAGRSPVSAPTAPVIAARDTSTDQGR